MEIPVFRVLLAVGLSLGLYAALRVQNRRSVLMAIARHFWFYKLGPHGRGLFYIGCITGGFGSLTLNVPVYILLCVFFSLGLCALLANMLFAPRLEILGTVPAKGAAGQAVVIDLQIRNRGRFAAYDVDAGFPVLSAPLYDSGGSSAIPLLAAGSICRAQRRVVSAVRGVYRLPRMRAFSSFPFGIVRGGRGEALASQILVVVPHYHSLEQVVLPVGRRYQPGGVSMTSDIGESLEYLGNREYRPGDRLKHIEHRAWARTGRLAVREFREEFYARVAIILDTQLELRLVGRRQAARRFEAAISLTASVSEALSRGEYLVDLFAAGPNVHVFHAGRHTAHLENILEILAGVGPCRTDPFGDIASELAGEIARTSSVVCVFTRWNDARRALVEMAVDSGCAVKVLLVGEHDLSGIPEECHPLACAVQDIETGRLGTV